MSRLLEDLILERLLLQYKFLIINKGRSKLRFKLSNMKISSIGGTTNTLNAIKVVQIIETAYKALLTKV